MTIPLPRPPMTAGLSNVDAASAYGLWLMEVARQCGEPAISRAIGLEWPGTPEQRYLLAPGHIETARNEARQLSSEVWAQERMEKGKWGV